MRNEDYDLMGCWDDQQEREREWNDRTPVEHLRDVITGLQAQLQLAQEHAFFQAAEIARLNAEAGQTSYQTVKTP